MAKSFFSQEECRQVGFSEPMIATLEKIADFVSLVSQATSTDDDLTTTAALLVATEARVDDLEAAGPYVLQDVGAAWTDPSATVDRSAVAAYSATVSATYVQAEVQALSTQLTALTKAVAGLVTDLRANGSLT